MDPRSASGVPYGGVKEIASCVMMNINIPIISNTHALEICTKKNDVVVSNRYYGCTEGGGTVEWRNMEPPINNETVPHCQRPWDIITGVKGPNTRSLSLAQPIVSRVLTTFTLLHQLPVSM